MSTEMVLNSPWSVEEQEHRITKKMDKLIIIVFIDYVLHFRKEITVGIPSYLQKNLNKYQITKEKIKRIIP